MCWHPCSTWVPTPTAAHLQILPTALWSCQPCCSRLHRPRPPDLPKAPGVIQGNEAGGQQKKKKKKTKKSKQIASPGTPHERELSEEVSKPTCTQETRLVFFLQALSLLGLQDKALVLRVRLEVAAAVCRREVRSLLAQRQEIDYGIEAWNEAAARLEDGRFTPGEPTEDPNDLVKWVAERDRVHVGPPLALEGWRG